MSRTNSIIEYAVYLCIPALFLSISLREVALTVIFLAWFVKHSVTKGSQLGYLRHPLIWVGLMFGGLLLVSTFYASNTLKGLQEYKDTIGGAMILLLAIPDVFRSERQQSRLLRLLAYTALGLAVFQLGRYITDYVKYGSLLSYAHYRDMSEPLVLFMPFALVAALLANNRWPLFLWSVVVLLLLGLVLATGARGAWVAAIVALFLWPVLKLEKKIMFFIAVLSLITMASFFWFSSGTILEKKAEEGLGGASTMVRIDQIWPQTYEMIAARPWLGYGYGDYYGELVRQSANHPWWVVERAGPYGPHNIFLEIWFSAGIVPLICLIYLSARLFKQLVVIVRSAADPQAVYFALATLSAFTANYLVRGFVETMNWAALGLLLGIVVMLSEHVEPLELVRSV
jgi:O-antigen ligase